MNLKEYIQSEIKSQLGEVGSGMFGGADDTDDFSRHIKTKKKRVNWAEFYKMAKDTSGYNPSFEKKIW